MYGGDNDELNSLHLLDSDLLNSFRTFLDKAPMGLSSNFLDTFITGLRNSDYRLIMFCWSLTILSSLIGQAVQLYFRAKRASQLFKLSGCTHHGTSKTKLALNQAALNSGRLLNECISFLYWISSLHVFLCKSYIALKSALRDIAIMGLSCAVICID